MPSEHAGQEEAVNQRGLRVEADPEKIIAILRQENEQLRHEQRIMAIAYQEAQEKAAELRSDIDALALQIAANEEDHSKRVVSKAKTGVKQNGSK